MKIKLLLIFCIFLLSSACTNNAIPKTAINNIVEYTNPTILNISEINCPDETTEKFKNFILNDISGVLENNSELLYMLDAFDTGVYTSSSLKDAWELR